MSSSSVVPCCVVGFGSMRRTAAAARREDTGRNMQFIQYVRRGYGQNANNESQSVHRMHDGCLSVHHRRTQIEVAPQEENPLFPANFFIVFLLTTHTHTPW